MESFTFYPNGLIFKAGYKYNLLNKNNIKNNLYIEPLVIGKYYKQSLSTDYYASDYYIPGDLQKLVIGMELLLGYQRTFESNLVFGFYAGAGYRYKIITVPSYNLKTYDNNYNQTTNYNYSITLKTPSVHFGLTFGYTF